MTLPPPPSGNPGPPPQYGGGDPFGPPQGGPSGYPGSQGGPPQHHAPQWQPPQQQQPPAWAPNPGAQPPGPPPKKRGNAWNWALGGVALLAVIGVTAAVSISVVKGTGGGDGGTTAQPLTSGVSQSPTASNSDIASANDTGPATIITEDPTCAAWMSINKAFVDVQENTGWAKRDPNTPATGWSPELKAQYEAVGKAARAAADQTVGLAKKTPHRVMREFYEQFIAYSRLFANSVDSYNSTDVSVSGVMINSSIVLANVCAAIEWKSAQSRAPLVTATPQAPANIAKVQDPSDPARLLSDPDSTCPEWVAMQDKYNQDTAAWASIPTNLAADQWSAEDKAAVDSVIPIMNKFADDVEQLAARSNNTILKDFAGFGAQYRRAFAAALPSYTTADSYLNQVGGRSIVTIRDACKAAGG